MDENDVILHLCKHLEATGWTVAQAVRAGERGIDVIACSAAAQRLLVEAKGGTSSREGSNRYGKPYTKSQVFDVCSKGLMQCFHHAARKLPNELIGFAYPQTRDFSDYIDPIIPIIHKIGITLFTVEASGRVTVRSPNHVLNEAADLLGGKT